MDNRRINIGTESDVAQRASNVGKQADAVQSRASGAINLPRFSFWRKEPYLRDNRRIEFDFEETNVVNDHISLIEINSGEPNTGIKLETPEITGLWSISVGVAWDDFIDPEWPFANTALEIWVEKNDDNVVIPQSRQGFVGAAVRQMGTDAHYRVVQSNFLMTIQESDYLALCASPDNTSFSENLEVETAYAWFQGFRIGA